MLTFFPTEGRLSPKCNFRDMKPATEFSLSKVILTFMIPWIKLRIGSTGNLVLTISMVGSK